MGEEGEAEKGESGWPVRAVEECAWRRERPGDETRVRGKRGVGEAGRTTWSIDPAAGLRGRGGCGGQKEVLAGARCGWEGLVSTSAPKSQSTDEQYRQRHFLLFFLSTYPERADRGERRSRASKSESKENLRRARQRGRKWCTTGEEHEGKVGQSKGRRQNEETNTTAYDKYRKKEWGGGLI